MTQVFYSKEEQVVRDDLDALAPQISKYWKTFYLNGAPHTTAFRAAASPVDLGPDIVSRSITPDTMAVDTVRFDDSGQVVPTGPYRTKFIFNRSMNVKITASLEFDYLSNSDSLTDVQISFQGITTTEIQHRIQINATTANGADPRGIYSVEQFFEASQISPGTEMTILTIRDSGNQADMRVHRAVFTFQEL